MPTLRSIRTAAVLYVLLGVLGVIGLMYIPRLVLVPGDPVATLANLREHQSVVRLWILDELFGYAGFIAVAFALYRVFKRVDRELGAAMVLFAALAVPPAYAASAATLGALAIANGSVVFPGTAPADLDAIAYVLVRMHGQLLLVSEVFWGLWLLPLAALELRSGFVPRVVGAAVFIGGLGYLADVALVVTLPDAIALRSVATALQVGELGTIVWLVARSIRPLRRDAVAPAVAA